MRSILISLKKTVPIGTGFRINHTYNVVIICEISHDFQVH